MKADRFAVAPQGVFQQVGELGLPKRHMPLLVAESIHCLLQKGQRLVDGIGFLQQDLINDNTDKLYNKGKNDT